MVLTGPAGATFSRLSADLSAGITADNAAFAASASSGQGAFIGLVPGVVVATRGDGRGPRPGAYVPAAGGVPVVTGGARWRPGQAKPPPIRAARGERHTRYEVAAMGRATRGVRPRTRGLVARGLVVLLCVAGTAAVLAGCAAAGGAGTAGPWRELRRRRGQCRWRGQCRAGKAHCGRGRALRSGSGGHRGGGHHAAGGAASCNPYASPDPAGWRAVRDGQVVGGEDQGARLPHRRGGPDHLSLGCLPEPTRRAASRSSDIDMITDVAAAIFGMASSDPSLLAHIHFKAITDPERIPYVQNGTVDIVAYTMTVNCSRKTQVDFSSIYYDAKQQVLGGHPRDRPRAGPRASWARSTRGCARRRELGLGDPGPARPRHRGARDVLE